MDSIVSRIQKEINEWRTKNFPDATADHQLIGMFEEIGELSHAHLKEIQGIRTNEDHIVKAKDAIGDLLIYTVGYCALRGFDINKILIETWDEVKQRNWDKFPKDGRTE